MVRSFQESVFTLVERRSSYRSYLSTSEETPQLEALESALGTLPECPFGTPVRVVLIRDFQPELHGVKKLGTYGVIRGAKNFLVGLMPHSPYGLEDLGFVFEWAILTATDLGLHTCWVGGTLDRAAFAQAARASSGEIVPVVSPVGIAAQHRSLVDKTFRLLAGSKERKAFNQLFFIRDFETPFRENNAPLARALELVRLAPSASNQQPWRVLFDPERGALHFFLKRTPGYRKLTAVDLQRIDIGIAMCHFELGCRELGIMGSWRSEPPVPIRFPPGLEHRATFLIAEMNTSSLTS